MSEGFRKAMTRKSVLWSIWVVYVAGWTAALLTPHPARVAAAVLPADDVRFYVLKTVHVLAYLILTVLTGLLLVPRPWRWLLLFLLFAHGMGTEYLQQFVPRREGSWRDVGLDHFGICLGILLSWKWWFAPSATAVEASTRSKPIRASSESTMPIAGPSV
jgi:VanZ family protein